MHAAGVSKPEKSENLRQKGRSDLEKKRSVKTKTDSDNMEIMSQCEGGQWPGADLNQRSANARPFV